MFWGRRVAVFWQNEVLHLVVFEPDMFEHRCKAALVDLIDQNRSR